MINFGNTWHLNEAETSRNDWWWEKIIRQMSRVQCCAWWQGLACLGYRILIQNGNERPLWKVGDDQPTVTYKLFLAHVSLVFTPSWPIGSWCLPSMTSQRIPDKAGLVFHEVCKMQIYLALHVICSKVTSLFWALSKISLTSPPLQKKKKSQTPFNTLQKGLWRQRLKWEVMQIYSPYIVFEPFLPFF